jgi:uncharacterized protein (TIGR03083 family)
LKMSHPVSVFTSATRAFTALVHEIPESGWQGPGLGDWDLRALVGHASRSLITVSEYLRTPCDHEDVGDAAAYYAYIRTAGFDPAQIVERGRRAGRALGHRPADAVDEVAAQALSDIAAAGDPLITVIGGLGIRLSNYLPTRTFELAVHSLDIARAADLPFRPPAEVMSEAISLAAQIAVALGDGVTVLDALTGRSSLPPGYSVV